MVWSQLLLLQRRECICRRNQYYLAVSWGCWKQLLLSTNLLKEPARPPFPRSYTSKGRGHFHSCYLSPQHISHFRPVAVKGKVSCQSTWLRKSTQGQNVNSAGSIHNGSLQPDCKFLQSSEDPQI